MFDDVDKAKTNGDRGNRPVPGHYIMLLDRVKSGVSEKKKGPYVAIEMRNLLTLQDGDIPVNEQFESLGSEAWHRPGEMVTQVLMARNEMFLSNFKTFVHKVGGYAENAIDKALCEKVTGEGILNGLFIEWRCRPQKTVKDGKLFNALYYEREVSAKEVLQRVPRETLDMVLGPGVIDEIIAAEEGTDRGN